MASFIFFIVLAQFDPCLKLLFSWTGCEGCWFWSCEGADSIWSNDCRNWNLPLDGTRGMTMLSYKVSPNVNVKLLYHCVLFCLFRTFCIPFFGIIIMVSVNYKNQLQILLNLRGHLTSHFSHPVDCNFKSTFSEPIKYIPCIIHVHDTWITCGNKFSKEV